MSWQKSSISLIERFNEILDRLPDTEPRKMFGCPCRFVRGNMFTGLHEEDWILRLNEEDREEMQATHPAKHFDPMGGRPMREYLCLPKAIIDNDELLMYWVQKSYAYASSIPPKSRRKKRRTYPNKPL